jgi:rhodanese-related sulfurtransferase
MKLGTLLVEAKLTEGGFQQSNKQVLADYRDFHDVFDAWRLPQTESRYLSYQLLRNVLAAAALHCSFCVLLDARRPDLFEAWHAIMACVKPVELRTSLRVLTWQELAKALPPGLQSFLKIKYGICP